MPAGVYLHIPFCKSRCSYCDFATDVYRDVGVVERYVRALITEVTASHGVVGVDGETRQFPQIDTIYFGGGTPSLLSPDQVGSILEAVKVSFDVAEGAEITMEMNPATVTPASLSAYRALGVNRASFGVQTFDDRALKMLARGHDANDARSTFRMLRDAGFENVSFDLIAGLPGQTLGDWERNLDEALTMQPEHLSLYLLEVHESTPLAEQIRSRRQPKPDEDLAAEMYEMLLDRTASEGYQQYEISNFSLCGFESRHNSKYWTLDPVYGFGVSAHSFDGSERYANERDTAKYVAGIEGTESVEVYREKVHAASEFIFLGLRLNKGVNLEDYQARFGTDALDRYKFEMPELFETGLLSIEDSHLRLTRKGMLFSNEVFERFV